MSAVWSFSLCQATTEVKTPAVALYQCETLDVPLARAAEISLVQGMAQISLGREEKDDGWDVVGSAHPLVRSPYVLAHVCSPSLRS